VPRKNYFEGVLETGGSLEFNPSSSPPTGRNVNDVYLDDGTNTGSGNPGWRYLVSTGPDVWADVGGGGGVDTTAIHKTTADEFDTASLKATPVNADRLLIEDSADSLGKKYVTIGTLPTGSDSDAIHDNVAAEISAITAKAVPTTSDYLVIEDAADSDNKKSITIGDLPEQAGIDSTAVHDNVAAEISAVTEKATPVSADLLLIEDSADSNNKKRVQVGNLPSSGGGGGESNLWMPPENPHVLNDEFDQSTLNPAWFPWFNAVGSFSVGTVDAYDLSFTSGTVLRVDQNPDTRRSWLLVQPPRTSGGWMFKEVTLATNVLMVCRMKFSISYTGTAISGDGRVSFVLLGDNSGDPDPDNRVTLRLNAGDANEVKADFSSRVGGSWGLSYETTDTDQKGQALEYVAIHKIGTTYHGWVGTASGNWIWMNSISFAVPIAYLGFLFLPLNVAYPGTDIFGIDFIRFYETDNFLF